jgi:peroxiredoxin/predicted 2-oxoglutarate/Fe(II)-dependent dioxygenase YbiX
MRKQLQVGDPAPWFVARSSVNPSFLFDSVGGYYVVLFFAPSGGHPPCTRVLQDLVRQTQRFVRAAAVPLCVTIDRDDETTGRLSQALPNLVFFWDSDLAVSSLYGIVERGGDDPLTHRPQTLVLDPLLRVVGVVPLENDGSDHVEKVLAILERQPPIGPPVPAAQQAPVLVLSNVFEPDLCRELISYYDRFGGEASGFMREVGGMTVPVQDAKQKRRRDQDINDEDLKLRAMAGIHDRVAPEIRKAFQFHATRIERHIVACYDAADGGHFRAHRDNTTKGTAHRRFAVSLMLNTGEYEGGVLRFPEFGPSLYTAPTGSAVVFSCSLLHEATPVTRGRRYAYLPFLYDEAAAVIRQQNQGFLQGEATTVPTAPGDSATVRADAKPAP